MPIAPDLAVVLEHHSQLPSALNLGDSIAQGRATHERDAAYFTPAWLRRPVPEVEELVIGQAAGIRLRIYRPDEVATAQVPTVLWIHGGGWVTGSLHTADTMARQVASDCAAVVVSVDYRLAPEHPWPAGLDDVITVFGWLRENIDALGGDIHRIGVGGDSAGGNLAAVLAQLARDEEWPLRAQLLVYPVTDCDLDGEHPSRRECSDGPYVTWQSVADCIELYLPAGADPRDPQLSPLHNPELSGLAAAVVATVELDPLRDEGEAYADALAAAGVRVIHQRTAGLPHGAFDMAGSSAVAARAVREATAGFRQLLNEPTFDAEPEPVQADDLSNIPARFLHVNKAVMLARAPLPPRARRQLVASVTGTDYYAFRRTELTLARAVQQAATELLDDAGFREALAAVPFGRDERIIALGDSITDDSCSWAEQLRAVLAAVRPDLSVVNLGVTGATTQDQLARVDLLCAARPSVVIQLLGTNDARRQGRASQVRMLELTETETNLGKLAAVITGEAGARLIRMTPTPVIEERVSGWAPFAAEQISWRTNDIAEVAAVVLAVDPGAIDLHAALAPVAGDLLLPDGVHPNVHGQSRILRTLVAALAQRS